MFFCFDVYENVDVLEIIVHSPETGVASVCGLDCSEPKVQRLSLVPGMHVVDLNAPSKEELENIRLRNVETKESAVFDEAPYKAAWLNNGCDGSKVAASIGLKRIPQTYDEYIAMCRSGQFRD